MSESFERRLEAISRGEGIARRGQGGSWAGSRRLWQLVSNWRAVAMSAPPEERELRHRLTDDLARVLADLLTDDDRRMLAAAAVSPSNETDNLLSLIERLTGEAIVPADGSER